MIDTEGKGIKVAAMERGGWDGRGSRACYKKTKK